MTYAKVFKEIREEMNLSRQELAKQLGITKSALWKIENGLSTPKPTTIYALSVVSNIPMARIQIGSIEPEDFFPHR